MNSLKKLFVGSTSVEQLAKHGNNRNESLRPTLLVTLVVALLAHPISAIDELQGNPLQFLRPLSWHTDEAAAKEEAAETNKPLFLYFTADWCHFCHKMEKETLNTPKVSKYLRENFILFKVDYDNHKDLVARYRVRGVPACIIGDPALDNVVQNSGFMEPEAFLNWAKKAADSVSPEAIAAKKAAAEQYIVETRKSFRSGLTEEQYKAIRDFFTACGEKDPKAMEFAKTHLVEEIEHQPNRFCRFLKDDKLHIRIMVTNAFAKIYGNEFQYDPWDKTTENDQALETFLASKNISSLLEDLIDF